MASIAPAALPVAPPVVRVTVRRRRRRRQSWPECRVNVRRPHSQVVLVRCLDVSWFWRRDRARLFAEAHDCAHSFPTRTDSISGRTMYRHCHRHCRRGVDVFSYQRRLLDCASATSRIITFAFAFVCMHVVRFTTSAHRRSVNLFVALARLLCAAFILSIVAFAFLLLPHCRAR